MKRPSTTRTLMQPSWKSGAMLYRFDTVQWIAQLWKHPPRNTRSRDGSAQAVPSTGIRSTSGANASWHHSHMLPDMS